MALTQTELGASVSFSPRWWSFISSTRIFVQSFCGHNFGDDAFSDRVAMVAHELMENAVKYSARPDGHVTCTVEVEGPQVRINVENPASPEDIATLRDEMAFVSQGDPLEVYVLKMQRSAMTDKSQIGLARCRYEGKAELSFTVDRGIITVEALVIR